METGEHNFGAERERERAYMIWSGYWISDSNNVGMSSTVQQPLPFKIWPSIAGKTCEGKGKEGNREWTGDIVFWPVIYEVVLEVHDLINLWVLITIYLFVLGLIVKSCFPDIILFQLFGSIHDTSWVEDTTSLWSGSYMAKTAVAWELCSKELYSWKKKKKKKDLTKRALVKKNHP